MAKNQTNTQKTSQGDVDAQPQEEGVSAAAYQEAVDNDPAVQAAKGEQLGEQERPPLEEQVDDTPENKEIIQDDQELKEAVIEGDKTVIGAIPGYNQSVVEKPMVNDYLSNRPVYETNEQAMLALAAQGKLATEAPSDKEVKEIQKKLESDK